MVATGQVLSMVPPRTLPLLRGSVRCWTICRGQITSRWRLWTPRTLIGCAWPPWRCLRAGWWARARCSVCPLLPWPFASGTRWQWIAPVASTWGGRCCGPRAPACWLSCTRRRWSWSPRPPSCLVWGSRPSPVSGPARSRPTGPRWASFPRLGLRWRRTAWRLSRSSSRFEASLRSWGTWLRPCCQGTSLTDSCGSMDHTVLVTGAVGEWWLPPEVTTSRLRPRLGQGRRPRVGLVVSRPLRRGGRWGWRVEPNGSRGPATPPCPRARRLRNYSFFLARPPAGNPCGGTGAQSAGRPSPSQALQSGAEGPTPACTGIAAVGESTALDPHHQPAHPALASGPGIGPRSGSWGLGWPWPGLRTWPGQPPGLRPGANAGRPSKDPGLLPRALPRPTPYLPTRTCQPPATARQTLGALQSVHQG